MLRSTSYTFKANDFLMLRSRTFSVGGQYLLRLLRLMTLNV